MITPRGLMLIGEFLVIGLGPGRGAAIQAEMWALAFVNHFDVFIAHGHACTSPGSEDLLVIHIVFQTGKVRLGDLGTCL